MKTVSAHTSVVLLVMSLIMMMADGSFINKAFSGHHPDSYTECSDVSGHVEYSHSACFEDDVIVNHLKVRMDNIPVSIEPVTSLQFSVLCNFTSGIWQPPKFS
jgi:hypothetical protein